jgi:hypothetical protein
MMTQGDKSPRSYRKPSNVPNQEKTAERSWVIETVYTIDSNQKEPLCLLLILRVSAILRTHSFYMSRLSPGDTCRKMGNAEMANRLSTH